MMWVNIWNVEFLDQSIQDELRLYEKLKPDLILHDTRPSIPISARLARLPCVSITNAYLTLQSVAPWRVLPPLLHPFLEPLRRYMSIKPHNEIRRKYGQPPTRIRELAYEADMVLLADIPEYAPTRDLPDKFHYVGPLVWEPAMPWPAELDEFLGRNQVSPKKPGFSGSPVIYFTLGSTGLPTLFREIVEQLRDTEYRVVITTGGLFQPADLGPLPDHFYATAYLPGNEIMQRCDVVICQAGSGTIYQALGAGVPIIGVPAHGEQWQNVWLMKRQGVGTGIKPQQMPKIKQVIERVLNTPSYKENAVRLQKLLADYDGPRTAAQLIHEHLSS
jgi:UDP:flavonoid glycosyltransferase YjiC (YdhE family)